jgi:cbb3-type cytochrome oxidase maturation protein
MSILFVLVPISLGLVAAAVCGFIWAVGNGQFDDLDSPGWDALRDEAAAPSANNRSHGDA